LPGAPDYNYQRKQELVHATRFGHLRRSRQHLRLWLHHADHLHERERSSGIAGECYRRLDELAVYKLIIATSEKEVAFCERAVDIRSLVVENNFFFLEFFSENSFHAASFQF
jgi:hypothetical protein